VVFLLTDFCEDSGVVMASKTAGVILCISGLSSATGFPARVVLFPDEEVVAVRIISM